MSTTSSVDEMMDPQSVDHVEVRLKSVKQTRGDAPLLQLVHVRPLLAAYNTAPAAAGEAWKATKKVLSR